MDSGLYARSPSPAKLKVDDCFKPQLLKPKMYVYSRIKANVYRDGREFLCIASVILSKCLLTDLPVG